jgi:hypothetical protein
VGSGHVGRVCAVRVQRVAGVALVAFGRVLGVRVVQAGGIAPGLHRPKRTFFWLRFYAHNLAGAAKNV